MNYARKTISEIAGYVPGEQPQGKPLVKLNTNENPYPPSPKVLKALADFDAQRLRLYSDPVCTRLRETAARIYGLNPSQILAGNGSDDLLTIALRTFVDQGQALAYAEPSYSLYPVLADLQGAKRRPVPLTEAFELPENAAELAGDAPLFIFARPNAPTGNLTPLATVHRLCREYSGVVWIDEAYVDFAGENCMALVDQYPNVVVSRTLSKSYSLAGLRLGLACANESLILEMNKVKDSYNVDMIAQTLATAALEDQQYMQENVTKIRATRDWLTEELRNHGCQVLPSATNFLFVKPATPAAQLFAALKQRRYLVRYFALPRVDQYLRITIGAREDMEGFLATFLELDR
ncbi:MAG: histidinol-phosphate transaminase [Victivallales bacterium]|nr:histidinol-phosphate transaminase [Victivallales bacterium]